MGRTEFFFTNTAGFEMCSILFCLDFGVHAIGRGLLAQPAKDSDLEAVCLRSDEVKNARSRRDSQRFVCIFDASQSARKIRASHMRRETFRGQSGISVDNLLTLDVVIKVWYRSDGLEVDDRILSIQCIHPFYTPSHVSFGIIQRKF